MVPFEVIIIYILVEIGHDGEDTHVDEHEDSKHEELGSLEQNQSFKCLLENNLVYINLISNLIVESFCMGNEDDDEVAECHRQQPCRLQHRFH